MVRRRLTRAIAYAWASPNSLLGLTAAALTWLTGGEIQRSGGVLEVRRGFARALLESRLFGANAMTLGHVVLARDATASVVNRRHELGHVRQAELLGPLFVPAYLLAGAWARLRGRHWYRDNWFERDANRRARDPVA
jgi:hypothetical protein